MSWVASLRSRTATDDPSATMSIGLGASYSKRTLPGFWMKKSPVVLVPSGPTCTKLPDQRLQRRQIGAHLGGLGLLVGVETGENTGWDIAARIGNHRIRRRRRGSARRHRSFLLLRRAHLHALARPRRRLRNRDVLRGSGGHDGWRGNADDRCRDQQRQSAADAAVSDQPRPSMCWISRKVRISVQRGVLSGFRPFYRGFEQRRYRFSVKIKCQSPPSCGPVIPAQKPLSSSSTRISRFPA